jgi:hypothetical protein
MRILVAAVGIALVGCTSITGPGKDREVGILEFYGDPIMVELPGEATAGQAFMVMVRTYGADGCVSQGEVKTTVDGLRATVTPYDFRSRRSVCPDILGLFDHVATLRFDEPGTAEITVRGRQMPGGTEITIERTVTIR